MTIELYPFLQGRELFNMLKKIVFLIILIGLFTGCTKENYKFIQDNINPHIDMYEIKLLMDDDKVIKLLNGEGQYADCVYGYERTYEEKGISIGFDKSKRVRKLILKNAECDIYGIRIGIKKDKAIEILNKNKYLKEEGSSRYKRDNVFMKILVNDESIVRGIILEIIPQE